jgi:hypothetical protein
MEGHDLLSDAYEQVLVALEQTLEGLKPEDLSWQPRPECNSIGWLAWHLTRGQDSAISFLMREDQLWGREGWHEKFGRPADPRDGGSGHTPEDIASYKSPDIPTIIGYHRAVLARSKKYFATLSSQDLDRVLNLKFLPPLTTLGTFLIMMLSDGMQHAGQMGYVRGMRHGMGWQKY